MLESHNIVLDAEIFKENLKEIWLDIEKEFLNFFSRKKNCVSEEAMKKFVFVVCESEVHEIERDMQCQTYIQNRFINSLTSDEQKKKKT